MTTSQPEHTEYRAGYVAIVGKPNVGKSTLVNTLLGEKISIVSRKPQSTRHKILGILSSVSSQVIFLDTPGLLTPQYRLHDRMMVAVHSAIGDANLILLMVEPGIPKDADRDISLDVAGSVQQPVFLLINKIDLVPKEIVLETISWYSQRFGIKEIYPISALNSFAIAELLKGIVEQLPVHPPFYPPDIISQHPERFFVSEIIREKIFELFRREVPYSTTVDIIEFREEPGRKDMIRAEIYVERASQKSIIIGAKGSALKEIGVRARKDIEAFLGRPVFLELFVKVREDWRNNEQMLKQLGYDS